MYGTAGPSYERAVPRNVTAGSRYGLSGPRYDKAGPNYGPTSLRNGIFR